MSKLTIELDTETHSNLKELARKDERSLTQYIGRVLRQHAGTLTTNTTTMTTINTPKNTPNEQKKRISSIVEDEVELPWN